MSGEVECGYNHEIFLYEAGHQDLQDTNAYTRMFKKHLVKTKSISQIFQTSL